MFPVELDVHKNVLIINQVRELSFKAEPRISSVNKIWTSTNIGGEVSSLIQSKILNFRQISSLKLESLNLSNFSKQKTERNFKQLIRSNQHSTTILTSFFFWWLIQCFHAQLFVATRALFHQKSWTNTLIVIYGAILAAKSRCNKYSTKRYSSLLMHFASKFLFAVSCCSLHHAGIC